MEEVTLKEIVDLVVIAYNASAFLEVIHPILASILNVCW
jgi:hypothetical protein